MGIKIRDVELDANFLDVDFMDRYEECAKRYQQEIAASKAKKYEKSSDGLRALISDTEAFFDEVFGDGTSDVVFGDCKTDLMEHVKAVNALSEEFKVQMKALNDMANTANQKQVAHISAKGPAFLRK